MRWSAWFTGLTLLAGTTRYLELPPVLGFDQLEKEVEQFQNSMTACRFQEFEKDKIFEKILKAVKNQHNEYILLGVDE